MALSSSTAAAAQVDGAAVAPGKVREGGEEDGEQHADHDARRDVLVAHRVGAPKDNETSGGRGGLVG